MSTTYEELLPEMVPRPISSERAYSVCLGDIGTLMPNPEKPVPKMT